MRLLKVLIIFALLTATSCATYQGKVEGARSLMEEGRFTEALLQLKKLADEPSKDQLIYLLDYATALQVAGDFKESNKYFLLADKLADIQDYTSLSLETGSFLTGEEMVQYKGEDFEVVLINAMSAINYLNLGDLENAMVEVRRLNEKLRRFRLEAKRKLTDNALALYLSAIIYEANQNWDDAAIAYEQVYNLNPHYGPLREDLIRSNLRARRMDAVKKWKALFPEVVERKEWSDKKMGEVVLIYQQGWGPRKGFRRDNMRYPAMYPIWAMRTELVPELNSVNKLPDHSPIRFRGEEVLFNVDRVAVESLDDQYAALVARRIGGAIAKEVVAERIRKENQLLGDLALIAMYATDRADLRQWSTLPKNFKIYRAMVPAGDYRLTFTDGLRERNLQIKPGQKVFVAERTF